MPARLRSAARPTGHRVNIPPPGHVPHSPPHRRRSEVCAQLPILAVLALVGSSPASVAQNHKGQAVTPDKIQWGPAPSVLPKGAEMAVLAGDPSKRGAFIARLKMPAGAQSSASTPIAP
jgi:hypothetical protein